MATNKLYYQDAYLKEFSAEVLSVEALPVEPKGSDAWDIVLDKTAFFPESGGQTGDRGKMGTGEVYDTHIKNEIIHHYVRFPGNNPPKPGEVVECSLDFDARFSKMQQHTGEHIFSGFAKKLFGYENVGFHLSDNVVTMDYDGPLSPEDVEKLEELSNRAIFEGKKVSAYFPDKETLLALNYRSKLDAEEMGDVRIVEIDGIDICACCAPHVSDTSQVGLLKVMDCTSYKGGVRISVLCGMRALLSFREHMSILKDLSHILSSPASELSERVKDLQLKLNAEKERVSKLEASELSGLTASLPNKNPVLFCNVGDKILLRDTVNSLCENCEGTVFAFNGTDKEGYNFILASKTIDAKVTMNALSETLSLKGGGKSAMVQGTCSEKKAAIEAALEKII